jgi:hypothetical protein
MVRSFILIRYGRFSPEPAMPDGNWLRARHANASQHRQISQKPDSIEHLLT